jgi:glutamate 5-kinase
VNKEREKIKETRRWVIKIGSALITDNGCGLKHNNLDNWVNQICTLSKRGIEVVIVSSGAVAEGLARLGWDNRPNVVHKLQAAAAVGQMGLIQAYEVCFQKYNKRTAQVLLTHDDIANRTRYLNARTSLNTLLQLGVIPIVNENDTVATDEIRFGDNDTLAGLVANLIDAELLVILTDQKGLYTSDPRENKFARFIEQADVNDQSLKNYAGDSSNHGRGGMRTKLKAASIAAKSNTQTVIASGNEKAILLKIAEGNVVGTLLTTPKETLRARKQWLANQSHLKGTITLDGGAVTALIKSGKSLLPIGVKSITGEFKRGEIISCVDQDGKEIARGLSNYDSVQARLIIGKSSKEIQELLDCAEEDEIIHRDNMILI